MNPGVSLLPFGPLLPDRSRRAGAERPQRRIGGEAQARECLARQSPDWTMWCRLRRRIEGSFAGRAGTPDQRSVVVKPAPTSARSQREVPLAVRVPYLEASDPTWSTAAWQLAPWPRSRRLARRVHLHSVRPWESVTRPPERLRSSRQRQQPAAWLSPAPILRTHSEGCCRPTQVCG